MKTVRIEVPYSCKPADLLNTESVVEEDGVQDAEARYGVGSALSYVKSYRCT